MHKLAPRRVAARGRYVRGANTQPSIDVAQFVRFMLGAAGLPANYAASLRLPGRVRLVRDSAGSYDASPSYDDSSSAASAAADAQAASDAENQAIQSMNDTNAATASAAAAEQENDAANAATLQTEINAGM